jgi:hypothetical protein
MAQKPRRESTSAASNPKLAESLAPARKETNGGHKGKLSLYPLSVEDALRAAARTGRVTPAKPKRQNQKSKKRSIAP